MQRELSAILNSIRRAGLRGYTERELINNSRAFGRLDAGQRDSAIQSLIDDGLVRVNVARGFGGRGVAREAIIATSGLCRKRIGRRKPSASKKTVITVGA